MHRPRPRHRPRARPDLGLGPDPHLVVGLYMFQDPWPDTSPEHDLDPYPDVDPATGPDLDLVPDLDLDVGTQSTSVLGSPHSGGNPQEVAHPECLAPGFQRCCRGVTFRAHEVTHLGGSLFQWRWPGPYEWAPARWPCSVARGQGARCDESNAPTTTTQT